MKQKAYQVSFPVVPFVVMVAFLSAIFFANVNPSFAASGSKKSSTEHRTSAVEYTEAQIKKLQSTLNITEAQKELWVNVTQVMRENAKDMDAFTKDRGENTKTMNAVEHMKYRRQIAETHLSQMNKLIPPFEAFYSSMSDQQKNISDLIFRTGRYGKHHRK